MQNDLNLLRLLTVLNEERQTTMAAKRLNVSQPTISVMLRKLREQFNDPLFIRDNNQFEPTVKCQQLLQQVPALLEQMDALYIDKDNWDISRISGEISLLFSPPLMSVIAASLIKKLTELAPHVTVECYQWGQNAIQDIEIKKMSWGFSYLPIETNKNILQKNIGSDQFMMVTRKDHPMVGNKLDNILFYPLCINIIPGEAAPSLSEKLFEKYALDKHVSVRSSDTSMMLGLVKNSDYIAIVSKHNNKILHDDFRVEELPDLLQAEGLKREVALFSHQRNRHEPLTQWLFNEARAIMSRQ
ncbi:LysR family transcriptional regulator [Psychromonas aquimarina]|uniref:LysR family transcriptional regulator n=1 Tax=Psychromonas aquimarina TaxID=444919 RepID=UPI0003FD892A|nr:LysR family transcriptional regulator [Psychromonas aquimarina]